MSFHSKPNTFVGHVRLKIKDSRFRSIIEILSGNYRF